MVRQSAVLLVAGALCVTQAEAGDRSYTLPADGGILVLPVPPGWLEEVHGGNAEGPPAITFHGGDADDFRVLIVPFPDGGTDVAAMVRGAARGIAPIAAEQEIEIKPLGGGAEGYWFGYTDATIDSGAPAAGEFRYTVQGAVVLGEVAVTFTVLTNDGGSAAIAGTLTMMRGARHRRGL